MSMEEVRGANTMEEAYNPEGAEKLKWASFVETTVAEFFSGYKLEKLTIEDGNGNKAKLSRTKDNGIKAEYTTTTTL